MKKQIILFAIVGTVIVLIGAAVLNWSQPTVRMIPSPNGYDDFVRAGQISIAYASDLSLEELQDYVKSNQTSLNLIREGLKKTCVVSFGPGPAGFAAHTTDVMAIKANAHLLRVEGNLAERENRFEDAAEIFLRLIEYGCRSSKGGVYIDKMVSRACEIMGMGAMTNVISKVDEPEFYRNAIKKLETLNSERESLDQADVYERAWDRQQGLQLKIRIEDIFSGQSRRIKKSFHKQMMELPLQSRQLSVIFAARLFEIENGRRPQSFSDLVPAYLKTVPVDPKTGKEIPFSMNLTKPSNEPLY